MNVLFIGDVVGKPGRRVLFANIATVQANYDIDFTIVNVENAAGGFGVTQSVLDEFLQHEINVMSSGNHIWDKREALDIIEMQPYLLRPHNYPASSPGSGWYATEAKNGQRVGVLNLMGTVFMHPVLDCPFQAANEVIKAHRKDVDVLIVDFHAEASSEKVAMGWHMDGRASAVLGTHTHVPTADERVLTNGTGFICDAGMTGCYNSIIGMDTKKSLARFVSKVPERMEVASGKASLCGVVMAFDDAGKCENIQRIRVDEK